MWFLWILALLTVVYYWLIFQLKKGWSQLPNFRPTPSQGPFPIVTILVPARNEEENIGNLLKAIGQQQYPAEKMEVVVINDHSTDRTAMIARSFSFVKLIELQEDSINAYKKRAIEKGIEAASGSLIVCTDADCIPGATWISTLVNYYQQHSCAFIAAPVLLENDGSMLGQFQTLDFLVMQGITGAGIQQQSIYMANGANMSYPKKIFEEVDGYQYNKRLASGDDFFLLHKIQQRYPSQIHYIKSTETIIRTSAMPTWSSFIQQRIRWASKSAHYRNGKLKGVLLLVGLYNLILVTSLLLGVFDGDYLRGVVVALLLKTIIEWPFVKEVAHFFKVPIPWYKFLFFQPIHSFYIVLTGLFSYQKSYTWKDRRVR